MPPMPDPNEQRRRYETWERLKDLIIDSNKRATELGVVALRSAILINGAAAIALLAFLAHIIAKDGKPPAGAADMLMPLSLLVYGVMAGALATGFGYLRMFLEGWGYDAEIKKAGGLAPWGHAANVFLAFAIAATIGSYVLFAWGVHNAADVLAALLKSPPMK